MLWLTNVDSSSDLCWSSFCTASLFVKPTNFITIKAFKVLTVRKYQNDITFYLWGTSRSQCAKRIKMRQNITKTTQSDVGVVSANIIRGDKNTTRNSFRHLFLILTNGSQRDALWAPGLLNSLCCHGNSSELCRGAPVCLSGETVSLTNRLMWLWGFVFSLLSPPPLPPVFVWKSPLLLQLGSDSIWPNSVLSLNSGRCSSDTHTPSSERGSPLRRTPPGCERDGEREEGRCPAGEPSLCLLASSISLSPDGNAAAAADLEPPFSFPKHPYLSNFRNK